MEWANGTEISGNSGQTEKKEIPRKVLPFFPKTFHRDEPFHFNSENSIQMVSARRYNGAEASFTKEHALFNQNLK